MFRATQLTITRGSRHLLRDVSCSFAPGRVTAVLGPNGAGKSTLLRVLTGELAPTAGTVSYAGRPLAAWPPRELARHRAVLPQESQLTFPFRVREVVLLGRATHGRGAETHADRAIADAALAEVGLTGLAERLFPSLSGGEKQRTHLARVLAQIWDAPPATRALLLDEPTASLDLPHQHATLALARRLAASGGTVLVVLHDLNLALTYVDDVLVLRAGRIAAAGPAAAVLTPTLVAEVFAVPACLIDGPGPGARHLVLGPALPGDTYWEMRQSCPLLPAKLKVSAGCR